MNDYEEAQWYDRCKTFHNYDGLRTTVRMTAYGFTQLWSDNIPDWSRQSDSIYTISSSWEEIREAFILASEILNE